MYDLVYRYQLFVLHCTADYHLVLLTILTLHKVCIEFLQNKPEITKLVTLSPLTPMATHFHIKNGAKLVQHNYTTQNFEYKLKGSK